MIGLGIGLSQVAVRYRGGGGTPTPSAQITSPTTYAQPAGTYRYQQPTADRPGTWSKGAGGDTALFAIVDPATGIYTIDQATAAGAYTLPLVFTPTDASGSVAQTVTHNLAAIEETQVQSLIIEKAFAGTAGAAVTTLSGWTMTGSSTYVPTLDGSGYAEVPATNGEGNFATYNLGADPRGSTTRIDFIPGSGSGIASSYIIAAASADDYLLLQTKFDGVGDSRLRIFLFRKTAGSPNYDQYGNVGHLVGSTAGKTGLHSIEVTVSTDGNSLLLKTLHGAVNDSDPTTKTLDITGATLGQKFGIFAGNVGDVPATGWKTAGFLSRKLLGALTLTSAPVYSTDNVATFALAFTGSVTPSKFRHRYRIGAGAWSDYLIGVSSVSDSTATYTATYPAKGDYITEIGFYNDTPIFGQAPGVLVNWRADANEIGGHPIVGLYYSPTPSLNNWLAHSAVNYDVPLGTLYIPSGGITTKSGQVDTITMDGSRTLTAFGAGVEVVSSTGGSTHTVKVTGDGSIPYNGGAGPRGFNYTGATRPTSYSVSRGGATGVISSEFVAAYLASNPKGLRNLDWQSRNKSQSYPLLAQQETLTSQEWGQYPPEHTVDALAALHAVSPACRNGWLVLPPDMTDAQVLDLATYMLAAPGTLCWTLEMGCEVPWNYLGLYCYIEGLIGGYRAGTSVLSPIARSDLRYHGGGDGVGVSPAMTANQYVFYNLNGAGFGPVCFRAKINVPAGSDIADNNMYFERVSGVPDGGYAYLQGGGDGINASPAALAGNVVVYNLAGSGNIAFRAKRTVTAGVNLLVGDDWELLPNDGFSEIARKFKSRRFNEYLDIVEGVFGAGSIGTVANPGRIRPALMGQAGIGSSVDLFSQMSVDFAASSQLASRIYYVGCANYCGDEINTATTKAQVDANFRSHLEATKARAMNVVTQVLRNNYMPASYEGGPHNSLFGGSGGGDEAVYRAAYRAWTRDAALGGAFEADMTAFMKTLPGLHMRYTTFGEDWGLMDSYADTSAPMLTGHLAGLAA